MLTFTKFEDLKQKLENELKERHRFPALFLFFKSQLSFKKVLNFLQLRTEFLLLDRFCKGEDLAPLITLAEIKSHLASKGPLTLAPFCAWLRLALGAPEILLKSLANLQSTNLSRLIIPLFDPEGLILSSLKELSRQAINEGAEIFRLEEKADDFKLFVSPLYHDFIPPSTRAIYGLKNYFKYWISEEVSDRLWLFTSKFRGVASSNTVSVFKSPSEIARYFLDNIKIFPAWSDDFWIKLLQLMKQYRVSALQEIVKKFFKEEDLKTQKLLEKLGNEEEFGKYLLIFWAKNTLQDSEDIWLKILASCNHPDEIGEKIYWAPLEFPFDLTFLKTRKKILKKLRFLPSNLEECLPKDHYKSLMVLTDLSHQEKLLALKNLGEILSKHELSEEIREVLKVNYPLLAYYFEIVGFEGESYLSVYRKAKVINHLPSCWPEIRVEGFPSRESILEKLKIPPECQIWLDGLGGEWLGVISFFINLTGRKAHITLARANLPTITETNKPPQKALFLRDLDRTGHNFYDDPYEYILEELDTLQRLWENKIIPLLTKNKSLVITADHGLTWKSLHMQLVDLPKGAKDPHRGGRVARIEYLSEEITTSDLWKTDKEDRYVCLKKHGLFRGGKKSYHGEGHGGALPEEILVPVIEILPEEAEINFIFELLTTQCQKNTKGEIVLKVKITPVPKDKVRVLLLGEEIVLQKERDIYKAKLTDIPEGKHEIELLIGGRKIGKEYLKVLPAPFTEEDMGI